MTPRRQRMLEDLQVRNLSPHTPRADVEHVAKFARHVGRSPAVLGPEEIRAYLVYLTTETQRAPSSVVIAVCALRVFYTVTLQKAWTFDAVIPAPKKSAILPVVLSPEEVVPCLACITHPAHRTILTTCDATGLRISEAVRLTISAVDSQRMVLRVEEGKGHQDRDVMLSPTLLEILRDWWRVHRPPHGFFPGEDPERPLPSHAVREACQRARVRRPSRHPPRFNPHSAAPEPRFSPMRFWPTARRARDHLFVRRRGAAPPAKKRSALEGC
jgi:integrase